jgi:hypothetical protein
MAPCTSYTFQVSLHHFTLPHPSCAPGELRFLDLRMSGDQAASSPSAAGGGPVYSSVLVRSVEAHSKGSMTALVAHPNAPLLATGSASQVRRWVGGHGHVDACVLCTACTTWGWAPRVLLAAGCY